MPRDTFLGLQLAQTEFWLCELFTEQLIRSLNCCKLWIYCVLFLWWSRYKFHSRYIHSLLEESVKAAQPHSPILTCPEKAVLCTCRSSNCELCDWPVQSSNGRSVTYICIVLFNVFFYHSAKSEILCNLRYLWISKFNIKYYTLQVWNIWKNLVRECWALVPPEK